MTASAVPARPARARGTGIGAGWRRWRAPVATVAIILAGGVVIGMLTAGPAATGQLDQVLKELATGPGVSEADITNVVDHFILQQPLADGRTVAEVFAEERPDLTDDDRQVLQSWREVVAGVFEVREQAGDSITATSLGDDRTYRIRANAGPASLAPMRPGCFMTARIVPVGDDWMLSGAQQLYAASERPAMLRLAAELATGHPHARTSTK